NNCSKIRDVNHSFVDGVCSVCGVKGGETGSCIWVLDGTVLTISGTGAMANYTSSSPAPWGTAITEVVIEKGVTRVGNYAFNKCNKLTSASIPNSVTTIGSYAFYSCTALSSVTIPDSVKYINSYAFYGCLGLSSIMIPKSVTSIASSAFSDCSSLESITVEEENKVYHSAGNCLIETESKTLVLGCKNSIIPTDGSVTAIGERAFYGCTGLTSVSIPDGVTTIGDSAFRDCSSLESVAIPGSVTTINDRAFFSCTKLISVTIPKSVNSVRGISFAGCSSLASITVEEGNKVYHSAGNCLIETESKTLVLGCKNSIIPTDGSVTAIGERAFQGCTGLTSVTLPKSVTTIYSYAFFNCTKLVNIWYVGTEENAADISIGTKNENLTSATWHYIDSYCDSTCNLCGETRTPADHVYDSDSDLTCNECGFTRLPLIITGTTGDCTWTLEGAVLTISGSGAMGTYSSTTLPEWGTDITEVIIENGVTSIGAYAFKNCASLTTVSIGDSVTTIASEAFRGCAALTSLTIGKSVKLINYAAFRDCTSLCEITLPVSVTTIGSDAFRGCSSITTVWYEGTSAQKEKITVKTDNSCLTSATWHCQDAICEHSYDNAYDADCNECGEVRVIEYITGDVNGDGLINNKDLGLLLRYINAWDVEIDTLAADVNRDGLINNKDLGILQRYVNGWSVE
ncbi:MAG: leucine-rich repeat protein, partial [Clostridia bacterium]|nr:leucine-rich repeat protein [Clostridia bacterium]